MRTEKIDLDYLVRYTNAHWLVIADVSSPDDGLFARDDNGKPLAHDKRSGALVDATRTDIAAALTGELRLPDGRTARPAFALIAERFLDGSHAPEVTATKTGVPAETVRRIARELARAAFEQRSRWTFPGSITPGSDTTRPSAVRFRCTRCAASRRIRTASRPAG